MPPAVTRRIRITLPAGARSRADVPEDPIEINFRGQLEHQDRLGAAHQVLYVVFLAGTGEHQQLGEVPVRDGLTARDIHGAEGAVDFVPAEPDRCHQLGRGGRLEAGLLAAELEARHRVRRVGRRGNEGKQHGAQGADCQKHLHFFCSLPSKTAVVEIKRTVLKLGYIYTIPRNLSSALLG